MTNRPVLSLAVPFLILGLVPALADTQIIPQVADGAGWSTTVVVTNKTASTQAVGLSFYQATGGGATSAWTPPFLETVNLNNLSVAAGSTILLHTPGKASALIQGWGALNAPSGVVGYAIFTANSGGPAQDATAPAVTAASRILVPFDNTTGLVSALAVVNPNGSAEMIQVNIKTSDGGVTTDSLPSLPGNGQTTFLMPAQFSQTKGKSGLAEFYVNSGTLSIIALRANGNALTSAPVYSQTGAPIIGATNTTQTPNSQTQVIPQVADGNGWSTTIALTNTTTGDLPVTLSFRMAVAGPAGTTTSWNPPLQESISLAGFILPAGSTRFLHTQGTAQGLTQGWAQLVADPRIIGYAIFTDRVSVSQAQDATAPAVSATTRILVPFDNTTGLLTAIAAVNPNGTDETMSVNIRTSDGTASSGTAISLPAQGQLTFLVPTQFAQTVGKSGLAEFFVSSGTISFIALRASGSAFTSAPTYLETGSPIITVSGGGTGGGGTGGGGGGGGTGNIVAGGFTVAKVSVTLTGSGIPTSTSETIGGEFYSYTQAEWQAPFSAPTFGPCSVLDITSPPVKAPYLPDFSLDAGTITVSGPNLTSGTIVPKSTTQTGPVYDLLSVSTNKLAYGGTYTISGSGGTQVGPFTASATIPQSFAVTNWDAITSINRANGLTVNWSGTGFDTVVIAATSQVISLTGQTNAETVTVSCVVPANLGTFSIPQGALAMLLPTQIATLTVSAATINPGTAVAGGIRTNAQTLVPNLVGGGQVNYGSFGGQISVLKSLAIQ